MEGIVISTRHVEGKMSMPRTSVGLKSSHLRPHKWLLLSRTTFHVQNSTEKFGGLRREREQMSGASKWQKNSHAEFARGARRSKRNKSSFLMCWRHLVAARDVTFSMKCCRHVHGKASKPKQQSIVCIIVLFFLLEEEKRGQPR